MKKLLIMAAFALSLNACAGLGNGLSRGDPYYGDNQGIYQYPVQNRYLGPYTDQYQGHYMNLQYAAQHERQDQGQHWLYQQSQGFANR
jgi:hypothetical protein